MKALITSGGRGTRLRPLTHTQNKHLIPIANKPILNYALEGIQKSGITDVGIIINAGNNEVSNYFGDGNKYGLNLTYISQEAPLGLAHVVKISRDFIGDDDFVFYLGDNMVVGGIDRFIDEFKKEKYDCFLTLARVKDPSRFGVPELKDNKIIKIIEKPKIPMSPFAVAGIYIYNSSIFEAVNNIQPSARGEYEISDAHQYLLEHNYKIGYSEITGWWKDTGNSLDLLEANRLILENMVPVNNAECDALSDIAGKTVIGYNTKILNSKIRGPVIIGADCVIENSYIGPFTSIDDGTVIINSEVEYSIILKKCKILNLNTRIEGSLLGNDVELVEATGKPRVQRFLIGDQSRVELV